MTQNSGRAGWRKLALQMLIGAVVGFFAAKVVLGYGVPRWAGDMTPGGGALAGVGLIYALMGLFVGLATALPGAGAKVLNVVDRDDLLDQRAVLIGSAVSCVVLGAALIAMALTAPGGPISGPIAVGGLAAALLVTTVIGIVQWKRYDELLRGVSLETSAAMALILMPVLSLWAALAHIGKAAPLDPLGVIALIMGTMLIASILAAGRRGLLLSS